MRVVVLGAGIIGTTTAFRLAEAGHAVTVVDRQSGAGLETSFANGGLITPATSDSWAAPGVPKKILGWLGRSDAPIRLRARALPGLVSWGAKFLANCRADRWRANTEAVLSLALLSVAELDRLTADEALNYDRNAPGLLKLFRDDYSMQTAMRAAELYRKLGVRADTLTPAETVRTEPALAPIERTLSGAVLYPDDASGDAFKFTEALAERARDRGVRFAFGHTIKGLERSGDRIEAVITDRGRITGDLYVLALGSYAAPLARSIGLRLPIYPGKGYSITVDAKGWNGAPRIPVSDDGLKAAVTPLGGRLRVAGTVEFDGLDTRLDAARGRLLVRNLAAILPEAPKGEIRYWAGLRPMTPSGRPLIGRTRIANLLVNAGHGPLGWTLAAGSARLIASIVQDEPPPVDPRPFDPDPPYA
jgi:D-amino-acid dehydrogenase